MGEAEEKYESLSDAVSDLISRLTEMEKKVEMLDEKLGEIILIERAKRRRELEELDASAEMAEREIIDLNR